MSDLTEILAKIEAGIRPAREPDDLDPCGIMPGLILKAFEGSNDAAANIIAEFLPGYAWVCGYTTGEHKPYGCLWHRDREWEASDASFHSPARSLLVLAIREVLGE